MSKALVNLSQAKKILCLLMPIRYICCSCWPTRTWSPRTKL